MGRNLLGSCLCGSFCVTGDLCGFPSAPKLTLSVTGLVCTDRVFPGAPSAWRGLGALVSAPRAGLCVAGLVWTCVGSLCPPSVLRGFCALASPHCLCAAQVCMPPLYDTPVPHFAPAVFVCPVTLGHLGPPLCCKGCVRWLGLYATVGSPSPPSVWGKSA